MWNYQQMETLPGLRAERATEKAALDHRKAKWDQARQAALKAMQLQQNKLQSVLRLVDQRRIGSKPADRSGSGSASGSFSQVTSCQGPSGELRTKVRRL